MTIKLSMTWTIVYTINYNYNIELSMILTIINDIGYCEKKIIIYDIELSMTVNIINDNEFINDVDDCE